MKEIEIYEKNNNIVGRVTIKGKIWKICFDLSSFDNFEYSTSSLGCYNNLNLTIQDNLIILKSNNNKNYIIKSIIEEQELILQNFITQNNNLSMIYHTKTGIWYILKIKNESKLLNDKNEPISEPSLPIIWKHNYHIQQEYFFESIIFDINEYNFYLKNNMKEFDKMSIKEIEAYPITIELSKSELDLKIKYIKDYINKKTESYDNIKNRIPINQDGPNSLMFYF
jgi:hypothetical protein